MARKMKEWRPPVHPLLASLPLLPELLKGLPEVPLLVVLPEVALLEVLPELVEPSGKGLWKGLLGTGLSWKGLQEWKQLPPEVMGWGREGEKVSSMPQSPLHVACYPVLVFTRSVVVQN